MERRIRALIQQPGDLEELSLALGKVWEEIPCRHSWLISWAPWGPGAMLWSTLREDPHLCYFSYFTFLANEISIWFKMSFVTCFWVFQPQINPQVLVFTNCMNACAYFMLYSFVKFRFRLSIYVELLHVHVHIQVFLFLFGLLVVWLMG